MKNIGFISNLFPSKSDPSFGSFVGLNFQQLKNIGYNIENPIVIDARVKSFEKILAYLKFFGKGIRELIFSKNDFFYIHYLTYSTLCLLPVLPFKNIRYVINIHGDDLVGTRLIHRIMGLPSSYILKKATAIVVPTLYFKRELLKRHKGVHESKIIISESGGYRENIFFPKPIITDINNHLHFGYISRIDEGKGWEVMLYALAELKKLEPLLFNRLNVSVYGAGSQIELFHQLVNELGLQDVVRYLGAMGQAELGDKYRSFDYFIFPTRRESFGLVAVEALACGIPVICSEIEPLTDIITHNKDGFLFKDGDALALCELISKCFSIDKDCYNTMSNQAVLSAERYSEKNVMDRLSNDLINLFYQ